ncbi:type VII secretion system-associated protein [Microbacterium sp. NPDC055903]
MSDLDMDGTEPHVNRPATPPITDALRAQARANPGGWVYAIDPEFDGSDGVPPEGIIGAWRSNDAGELSEEFTPNPRYVPSPAGRGWPAPTTDLERVLQLARAGHVKSEQFERAFADAEVVILYPSEGGTVLFDAKDGGQLAYAFTDVEKAAVSGYAEFATVHGRDFAASLPEGVRIALNPWTEVALVIDPADIPKT